MDYPNKKNLIAPKLTNIEVQNIKLNLTAISTNRNLKTFLTLLIKKGFL